MHELLLKFMYLAIFMAHNNIPYSGKLSYGANFCIFHVRVLHTKIDITKTLREP